MSAPIVRRTLIILLFAMLATPTRAADNVAAKEIAGEMKRLYDELATFKSSTKFHQTGLSPTSPFKPWSDRVKSLGDKMRASGLQGRAFLQAGFKAAPADLQSMALDYMKSNGRDTTTTKSLQKSFEDTFAAVLGE